MANPAIVVFLASEATNRLKDYAIDKILGVEMKGYTISEWGEHTALAIVFKRGLMPEEKFEDEMRRRLEELDARIDRLREDLDELRRDFTSFVGHVDDVANDLSESELWKDILDFEIEANRHYRALDQLRAPASEDDRKNLAVMLATRILDSEVEANVERTRGRLLGKDVGVANERLRGFLEIWKQQGLREVRHGWQGNRLAGIYHMLAAKFTYAVLLQMKSVRLLLEAHDALHLVNPAHESARQYFFSHIRPMMTEQVAAFRDVVESIAMHILPLPSAPYGVCEMPSEIEGMLAALDYLSAAMLGAAPLDEGSALAGCWGRVLIPGNRWIGRSAGSREAVQLNVNDTAGKHFSCAGTLDIRSVPKDYILYIGNEPRAMKHMLMAQFIPKEPLPLDVAGEDVDVRMQDARGELLLQTKASICAVPSSLLQAKANYGAFTITFTGGADIRSLPA